jgi:hypothetical protein
LIPSEVASGSKHWGWINSVLTVLRTSEGRAVPTNIWDRSGNPNRYVSDKLGISRQQLRERLHKIKAAADLKPHQRVIIYDNGDVRDAANGDYIGNLLNDF